MYCLDANGSGDVRKSSGDRGGGTHVEHFLLWWWGFQRYFCGIADLLFTHDDVYKIQL